MTSLPLPISIPIAAALFASVACALREMRPVKNRPAKPAKSKRENTLTVAALLRAGILEGPL